MELSKNLLQQLEDVESPDKQCERQRVVALQSFIDAKTHLLESHLSAPDEQLERLAAVDQINEAVNELDQGCSHCDQTVLVSGHVSAGYFDEVERKHCYEHRIVSDEPMISRGFTVQPVTQNGVKSLQVGHLFALPQESHTLASSGLVQLQAEYFAFAPYEGVAIESIMTAEQQREYLDRMIPDVMSEVDTTLYNAPDSVTALLRLRHLSIDAAALPRDIHQYLVGYVQDQVLAVDQLPLMQFELRGTRAIHINDALCVTAPYDRDNYTGGTLSIIGRVAWLATRPYTSYVDGEVYSTSDNRWVAGIDVQAASPNDRYYNGQELDVSIADINDVFPVQPTSEKP